MPLTSSMRAILPSSPIFALTGPRNLHLSFLSLALLFHRGPGDEGRRERSAGSAGSCGQQHYN